MDQPHFVFGHLPFWIITYTLALTAWACLGRFMMGFFIAPESTNYIWRGFRALSDWAVWCAARRAELWHRSISRWWRASGSSASAASSAS